jgi:TPR repeat protein
LGTPVNDQKAKSYFEKASKHKFGEADFHLGIIYRDGRGVAKNLVLADSFFQMANEKGIYEAKEIIKTLALRESDDINLFEAP